MTPEQLEKQKRFYTLVILIPVLIGLLWLCLGAFSKLLGFGSSIAYAGWEDPPPESNNNVNDLITSITDEGTYWRLWWDEFTIENVEGNELLFLHHEYFWDEEVWNSIGSGSVGVYPCELDSGKWWYKEDDPNVLSYYTDADLAEFGEGYYRQTFWAGSDSFGTGDPYTTIHWDGVEVVLAEDYEPPPLEPRLWSTSPASETEITDLETAFEFSWEDLDDWDTMSILFQNRPTGIFSEAQQFIIETTSPSGSMALEFQDFGFDRNGVFYFYGVATRYGVDFVEGMYITGRYSYEWSNDLVDPESWFTINIEGFQDIFGMSDFEEWYFSISKFATPTDMFVSIVGFFDPIFGKIGEFGNRIKDYFNLSEVYSQGYEIGKTIPYFTFFVAQVSMFFGGFPILKWLGVIILILIGVFIFRLILKFIPFLGGS